jgi:hypothetical protein
MGKTMKNAGRKSGRSILVVLCAIFAATFIAGSDQPAVHVEPADNIGPRPLEEQTQKAVIRDYLQAWHSLSGALEQNRASLLDADFVGTARQKLADTIQEQTKLGIQTRYIDHAHDVKLVFYSPEGLSIQLVDTVDYDVQLLDQGKVQTTQHVRARYVAVLTPTEVQWKVRVFQAEPE